MQTEISSQDFTITSALERAIRDKISTSTKAYADNVTRFVVRLKDLNGPKGGEDKECSVEIQFANQPSVFVRKRSSNAYCSIRKAIGRASRIALRKLSKRRARY